MNRTDYVARAKAMLQKSALVIVPLAVAASASATAVPTLPTGNLNCQLGVPSAFGGPRPCSGGTQQIVTPEINGTEFYTNGWQTMLPSGGSFTGPFSLYMTMRASALNFTDTLPISLVNSFPVFYDFTLEQSGSATIDSWELQLSILSRYRGQATFTGTSAGTFSGFANIALIDDNTSMYANDIMLFATLSVNGSRPDGDGQIQVNVPQNGSFDFGASAAGGASAAVPEPATAGIAVAGLALAAVARWKRQA